MSEPQPPVQHRGKGNKKFSEYPKKFVGKIPSLGTFVLGEDRMAADVFNKARRDLIDYLNVEVPNVGYAIEHKRHFDFQEVLKGLPSALVADATTHAAKANSNYLMQDIPKAYGIIFGQCDAGLRSALEEATGYASMHEKRDVLWLWTQIESKCLNPIRNNSREPVNIILRQQVARQKYDEFFQFKNETVAEFYRRFETEVEAATAAGIELHNKSVQEMMEEKELKSKVKKFLTQNYAGKESTPEAKAEAANVTLSAEEKQAVKTRATSKCLAYDFIQKLHRKRFGEMQIELQNRLNDNVDEYPTTLLDARRRAEGRVTFTGKGNGQVQAGVAFFTNGKSSNKEGNKNNKTNSKAKGNKERSCYWCGASNHFERECPEKAKALDEWKQKSKSAGEKANVHIQAVVMTGSDDMNHVGTEHGFAAVEGHDMELSLATGGPSIIHPRDILLDNQATISVFHQKEFLNNIRKAERPIQIAGVGGKIEASMVADFGTFGQVYYHPKSIANILSFSDAVKKYDVEYDRSEDIFKLTNRTSGKLFKFVQKNKLYAWNPAQDNHATVIVQTVEDNRKQFTKRELKAAEGARQAFIRLGRPSTKDFVELVRSGKLLHCPFTVKDIERAQVIYGPELGALKGRTVRSKPASMIGNPPTDVKKELSDISLSGDIFFIFGTPFLVTVSRKLKLIMVCEVNDRKKDGLWTAFTVIINAYNKHGYRITHFISDGEPSFKALEHKFNELNIIFDPVTTNEHVGEIERTIRLIKERCRSFINTLPYLLPKVLIVNLVYHCVSCINSFPKDGMEESPKEQFTGRRLDFNNDCRLEFGSYVQTHEHPTRSGGMDPRTIGAICIGPSTGEHGYYKFVSLATWSVITRRSWTELPIPEEVIAHLCKKALEDDQHGKLKDRALAKPYLKSASKAQVAKKEPKSQAKRAKTNPYEALSWSDDSDDEDEYTLGTDTSNHQDDFDVGQDDMDNDNLEDIHETPSVVDLTHDDNLLVEEVGRNQPEGWVDEVRSRFRKNGVVLNTSIKEIHKLIEAEKNGNLPRIFEDKPDDTTPGVVLTQMSVKAGIKEWGSAGIVAALQEMDQLLKKKVFNFVRKEDLTREQVRKALRTLIFLKKKRCGRIKGRCCVDGRPQARLVQDDLYDPYSPTVSIDTFMVSVCIDAYEKRFIATADIEGAYLAVDMTDEKVLVMLDPILTSLITSINPELQLFVTEEGLLYAYLGKALYGCIQSAKLFFEHLTGSLKKLGFTQNPYDACLLNKVVDGEQVTVIVYVDDVKISSKNKKLVDDTLQGLREVYKTLTVTEGAVHEYLGIKIDHSTPGQAVLSMVKMVKEVVNDYEFKNGEKVANSPASNDLFHSSTSEDVDQPLEDKERETFHSVVAKLLYIAKRTRPDVLTAVSYLTTRVKEPNVGDQARLDRLMRYLKGSVDLELTLKPEGLNKVQCYIDASHGCHKDGKGHTGVMITLGSGSIYASSKKQRLVSRSSTESELIGISDGICQAIWTRNLLKEQGYKVEPVVLYQDNTSTLTLVTKGRSTSERTKHVDRKYFFIHDRIETGEVVTSYKPTKEMIADILTKALQGKLFLEMRSRLMNENESLSTHPLQECVGNNTPG